MPRRKHPVEPAACGDAKGTITGYAKHSKAGEKACEACLESRRGYHRAYLDSHTDVKANVRRLSATYGQALTLLRDKHRAEFDKLLAKVREEAEA